MTQIEQTEATDLVKIERPTEAELAKQSNPILENANFLAEQLDADKKEMYGEAVEEIREIKRKTDALNERRMTITRPIDAAKASIMDLFRTPIATMAEADKVLRRALINFDSRREVERAEERKREEEAAQRERDRLAREAAEAEQQGDMATSMALTTASEAIAVQEPERKFAGSGISTTKRWSAEIVDKRAFIENALKDETYFDMIIIDMKPLNQMAVALKDKMNIPGVKAVANSGLTVRK